MKKITELDKKFQNKEVVNYYNILQKKQKSIYLKLLLDKILALILLIIFLPIMIIIAIWIKIDSEGEIFYRQKRITTHGKEFKIFKFRTMVQNAEQLGNSVTLQQDERITRVGNKLRKLRLDELPQLINVLIGDMSFVGTRPEIPKYVNNYENYMYATLLLPAGITSIASIEYKDEDEEIEKYKNSFATIDEIYIQKILPQKMKYNIEYIETFSILTDIKIMIKTVIAMIG